MKVLLFDTTQSYLTPGGKQVHAQKLYENLPKVDVDVDYARWWDPTQTFDIVHFFGYNAPYLINSIKSVNKKTVLTQIMDAQTSFNPLKKRIYSAGAGLMNFLPERIRSKFSFTYLNDYDALVYMHKFDRETAVNLFNVNEKKTFIIPHASDNVVVQEHSDKIKLLPEKYLVSAGSIVDRKRPVLLANLARESQVPVVFIGTGNKNDSYFKEFEALIDNKYVFYLGFVSPETKANVLSHSSGFVLLSTAESGCIAVFEAANFGLPLLLPDLLWAQCYSEPREVYHCNCNDIIRAKEQLQAFYAKAERKPYPSFKVHTWLDIALMYKKVYESILVQ